MIGSKIFRVALNQSLELCNCILCLSKADVFQRESIPRKRVIRIFSKKFGESFDAFLVCHTFNEFIYLSAFICSARAKSFSVRPPALWVEMLRSTLFHRISISG